MTPTNINFTPKKYAGAVGLNKLRFVGFIRFDGFNFSQIQKIRFVVVMVWSYSFGDLDSVK